VQGSSLTMSEAPEALEGMISHASGMIAAGKGKIKIRDAMRMVGFDKAQVETMSLYQKIRRLSQQMVVIDKRSVAAVVRPVQQVRVGSGDTVTSTLSSAERTSLGTTQHGSTTTSGDVDTETNDNDMDTSTDRPVPTPRRLMEVPPEVQEAEGNKKRKADDASTSASSKSKRTRRSSKEFHRVQANVIMQTKKESAAMKLATTRIEASKKLPDGHPDKKSMNQIVKEVNTLCDSNISPKTVGKYVRQGLINMSPLKRGPVGAFPKPILASLKWSYATYLQLEQAEAKTQSSTKDMAKRVNACVNAAGYNIARADLTRKLKRDTADLFDVGKTNVMEHRRLQWTTHQNLDLWFTTFKSQLIDLCFGREAQPEDDVEGEIVFFEGQLDRIINLDETDGSLDNTCGNKGGRPPVVFCDPDLPSGAKAANKSGYSSTVICGSTAAGEGLPPHFQLRTLSQSDETQKISVDWFIHAVDVVGKFGFEAERVVPTTFGMNEKGGMNAIELDKYIKKAILPLYPDVADVPGRRVLLKLDSGPGRMNLDMLADLRLQGVYVFPGVPNTTHVTQETDQNYGLYKTIYRENLEKLSEARQRRGKPISVSDLPLLVFGGYDYITKVVLANAFERAFNRTRNLSCWKKCGAVPLTRLPLRSSMVRHQLAINGSPETQEAERLKQIETLNHFHCDLLAASGFLAEPLRKYAPRSRKKLPAVTVPKSKERIMAIKNAKRTGQMFYATGGQHLNSDEFFQAREHASRLEKAKKTEDQKGKRLLLHKLETEARAILSAQGQLNADSYKLYKVKTIKLLCKWKRIKTDNLTRKEQLFDLYVANPEPPPPEPWTEEEESDLQKLWQPDMPLHETHLGVAARQMAVATSNNIARLDGETRKKLLQSLATFDRDHPSSP